MNRFADKKVIVAGAAAGLGRTIAQSFASEGSAIAVLDFQSAEKIKASVQAKGRRCATFSCDVSDEDAVKATATDAAEFFGGRIDVLVNNAGFNGRYHLLKDVPLEHWRHTLDFNLTGTVLATRAILPYMIAQGGGRIVTTASNVARRGLPYRADDVCSRWALLGLPQALTLEYAANSIRVNAVCPRPIEGDRIEDVTENHAEAEGRSIAAIRKDWEDVAAMKRSVTPREVANAMLFLCSDESSAMTGQALNITGGFLMT